MGKGTGGAENQKHDLFELQVISVPLDYKG